MLNRLKLRRSMKYVDVIMDNLFWTNLTFLECTRVLRIYDVIQLLVICLSYSAIKLSRSKTAPMQIPVDLPGYPIRLGDAICWPRDLSRCFNSSLPSDHSSCCGVMSNTALSPYQEVSNECLAMLSVVVPLFFLLLRNFGWEYIIVNRMPRVVNPVVTSSHQHSWSWKFKILLVWEIILGIIISCAYQAIVVDLLKEKVGFIRPNGQALDLWAQLHSSSRKDFATTAHRSFPSGHSSWSASGLGYSAMLYFKDATMLGDEDRYVISSRLAMLLAIAQLGIVAWIGATRIKDYWHHPADVVCGWLIGAAFAYYSYLSTSSSIANQAFDAQQKAFLMPCSACSDESDDGLGLHDSNRGDALNFAADEVSVGKDVSRDDRNRAGCTEMTPAMNMSPSMLGARYRMLSSSEV